MITLNVRLRCVCTRVLLPHTTSKKLFFGLKRSSVKCEVVTTNITVTENVLHNEGGETSIAATFSSSFFPLQKLRPLKQHCLNYSFCENQIKPKKETSIN